MSDDETTRPAAAPNLTLKDAEARPTSETPAPPTPGPVEPIAAETEPAAAAAAPEPAEPALVAAAPAPAPSPAPSRIATFLRANAVALVLAVLLVGAIVWGALGLVSANDWESRANALSSDLASAEETLAEAEATIDDLETAKSRAETTATACVDAIDDADAMLEVSAKLDDKTVVYLEGLNDFMAAVNAGDLAAAESVAAEIDKLTVQIEELNTQIEGHIDDYGDAAEGCHVDDAQDV